MKIAIVGLDNEFVEDFSNKLASIFKLKYVSFTAEFNKILLNFINVSSNEFFQEQESYLMKRLIDEDDIVFSVGGDDYISNKNYLLFKNVITIFIEKKEKNNILNNIQKTIKRNCKISVKQNKLEINRVIKKIRGNYNG